MQLVSSLVRRIVLAAAVLCALLPQPVYTAKNSAGYLAALESINADQLRQHVDYLADDKLQGRAAGKWGGRTAGDYVAAEFAAIGLVPAGVEEGYFQPFRPRYRNVLAVLPGSDKSVAEEFVIIGAHYDHVGYGTRRNSRGPVGYIHNGADDNASGTAGLLELAEAFKALPVPPRRSILFIAFDAEEKGLFGSKYWVKRPTVPLDRVVAMINMDMVGRLRDERLTISGSRSGYGLRRLISHENAVSELLVDFSWTLKPNADHYPFYRHDIPVLLWHTGLHDEYHSPRDDAHLVNCDGISRVMRLLFSVAYELANQEQPIAFRNAARRESEYTRARIAKSVKRPRGRLGISWRPTETATDGLHLTRVTAGSAADRAGMQVGDQIVIFDSQPIRSGEDLQRAVLRAAPKTSASIERPGKEEPQEVAVELDGSPMRLGIAWRIDEAEPGTVILTTVIPGSPAAQAGLQVGDRIYEIAGRDFADDREFAELARTLSEPLKLLIEREGKIQTILLYVDTKPLDRAA